MCQRMPTSGWKIRERATKDSYILQGYAQWPTSSNKNLSQIVHSALKLPMDFPTMSLASTRSSHLSVAPPAGDQSLDTQIIEGYSRFKPYSCPTRMWQSQDYSVRSQSLVCKNILQGTTSDACQPLIAWCHNRRLSSTWLHTWWAMCIMGKAMTQHGTMNSVLWELLS